MRVASEATGNKIYTRQLIAGTWSEWTSQPTSAEVDALNAYFNAIFLHSTCVLCQPINPPSTKRQDSHPAIVNHILALNYAAINLL